MHYFKSREHAYYAFCWGSTGASDDNQCVFVWLYNSLCVQDWVHRSGNAQETLGCGDSLEQHPTISFWLCNQKWYCHITGGSEICPELCGRAPQWVTCGLYGAHQHSSWHQPSVFRNWAGQWFICVWLKGKNCTYKWTSGVEGWNFEGVGMLYSICPNEDLVVKLLDLGNLGAFCYGCCLPNRKKIHITKEMGGFLWLIRT